MAYQYLRRAVVFAVLLHSTTGQRTNGIPPDMSAGFQSGDEVQVSYTNGATDGFASGTTFEKNAVAQEPEFALGDSNGISPTILHTMIMVDTTCPTARKIHYARSNFKFDFQGGTNIATESAPILDYKAPGAFGEKGDDRQYTFLMYINPERKEITNLQLPAEGEIFDIAKFERDNGLSPATAGVNMVVKLGGQADCEGGDASPAPPAQSAASSTASSSTASSAVASSSVVVSSSAAATSSTAVSSSTVATSSAAASSAAASPSSIAPSSAAATLSVTASRSVATSSSVAASSLVTATSTLVASLTVRPSAAPSSGGSVITVRPPTSRTTRIADANESQAPVSSAAGSATSAGTAPAEQTANAAAGQSFVQGVVVVPLLAMFGALAL